MFLNMCPSGEGSDGVEIIRLPGVKNLITKQAASHMESLLPCAPKQLTMWK
jgi:Ca2+-dependent lipid-binding protein